MMTSKLRYWTSFKPFLVDPKKLVCKPKTKHKKKSTYLNVPIAFDTETTSLPNLKTGFVYIWMLQIGITENYRFYGRTLDEFKEFIDVLNGWCILNTMKIVIYVHNLSFDFQFIRKYLDVKDAFITDSRQILSFNVGNIEFKDSYILEGSSLEICGKSLVHYKAEKLVGSLDYRKIRHSDTPLTNEELLYCEYDNVVLAYVIQEELEKYKYIFNIPATSTGKLRKILKPEVKKYNKEKHAPVILDELEYELASKAFQGGYTHANMLYVNNTIHEGDETIYGNKIIKIKSKDLTSSYPTVMLSEKFPVSKPIRHEYPSYGLCKTFELGIVMLQYTNLRSKNGLTCISSSKAYEYDDKPYLLDNGKIYEAEHVTTVVTTIDLPIIEEFYYFDDVKVELALEFKAGPINPILARKIMQSYKNKSMLKGVEGAEDEYIGSKREVNSMYGLTCQKPNFIEYKYEDGEFISNPLSYLEAVDGSWLYYVVGVFVTAYARRNLFSAILYLGEELFIYSDTDSVKYAVTAEREADIDRWFDDYNDMIQKKIVNNLLNSKELIDNITDSNNENNMLVELAENNWNIEALINSYVNPINPIDKQHKPLGVWDPDGDYTIFKTLGAKRYMTYDAKHRLKLTCAGLSKQAGTIALASGNCLLNNEPINVKIDFEIDKDHHCIKTDTPNICFELFSFGLEIKEDETGKNTHFYNDDVVETDVTDYLGETRHVIIKSGVSLEPASFKLNDQFNKRDVFDVLFGTEATIRYSIDY